MGCVSSKLVKREVEREILCGANGNHVVSLTSTTYGALKLEAPQAQPQPQPKEDEDEDEDEDEQAEVINAWELMGDLEEETLAVPVVSVRGRKSPGVAGKKGRSPFKRLNIADSPINKGNKLTMGKENRGRGGTHSHSHSHSQSQPCNSNSSTPHGHGHSIQQSVSKSCEKGMSCSSSSSSSRRKSLSPLFDPELVEAYEKELYQQKKKQQQQQHNERCGEAAAAEEIKKIISQTPIANRIRSTSARFDCHLDDFENKCPPGGEDSVVIYTTTLRGIRKTFEDCNAVRSMLNSYQIRMYERDLSMDSGFKEELRKLMGGAKEVRIPTVFVKGRLIGGAQDISNLEEQGKLGSLLHHIPRDCTTCRGCGGIRFIMCVHCNGSCKLLDHQQNSTIRCGECNENGLIHCPLCS